MDVSIKFIVSEDNTKINIDTLVPGCSEDMVRKALEDEGITTGIRWDRILPEIKKVHETGVSCRNVLAAESGGEISVQYGDNGPVISGEDIILMIRDFGDIHRALRTNDTSLELQNGVFAIANSPALTVKVNETRLNVYGNKMIPTPAPEPFSRDRSISIKTTSDGYQLIALTTGHLVVNESGAFSIVDPFFTSPDKLVLYCYVVPLVYGIDAFREKISKAALNSLQAGVTASGNGAVTISRTGHLETIELRRGKMPVKGRPGSIRFLVDTSGAPQQESDERVDYRDSGRFVEIAEGTLLAERIPMVQSVPGVNVFGEAIDIPGVKDIIFSYGKGVVEDISTDVIKYTARERGILEMNNNYLNIVPELIIHGNVDSSTGNINYTRTVVVTGTIVSGFKIRCGDLTVRESIEDCVEVVCSGNLNVSKGILGERTKVTVSGNVKAGLVQGASLRVNGDCIVDEFVYHANIFCTGNLTVNGKGTNTRERGCIIGGAVSSLNTMFLHSVGSVATLTTLCCGFDPEGFSVLMETINLGKTLKKKILLLQNNLQFNPSNKEAMVLKMKHYSAEKREAVKNTLQELRQTISQVEKNGASVALLSRKVFSSDMSKSKIFVRNQLIAPTIVEFPKLKKKIYRESNGVQICIVDGEIAMYEGVTDVGEVHSS